MKLLSKFNLILALVMALGVGVSAWLSRGMLQQQAQQEVMGSARLMMEQASAVRTCTSNRITKLLHGSGRNSVIICSSVAQAMKMLE